MVTDWVFNDLQQFLRTISCSNTELMQQLNHKTTESIKSSWDPGLRINFN